MEFLNIGDGTIVRLNKVTAVRTTENIQTGLKRIVFHTSDHKEWITDDQKAIEYIEGFFYTRTFQRRS